MFYTQDVLNLLSVCVFICVYIYMCVCVCVHNYIYIRRWAGHVECVVERRGLYMVLVEKREVKRPLG